VKWVKENENKYIEGLATFDGERTLELYSPFLKDCNSTFIVETSGGTCWLVLSTLSHHIMPQIKEARRSDAMPILADFAIQIAMILIFLVIDSWILWGPWACEEVITIKGLCVYIPLIRLLYHKLSHWSPIFTPSVVFWPVSGIHRDWAAES